MTIDLYDLHAAPRYEYQLKDFFFEDLGTGQYKTPDAFGFIGNTLIFSGSLGGIGGTASQSTISFIEDMDEETHIVKLFSEYIWPRCKNKNVAVRDEEMTTEEKQELFYKMCAWLKSSSVSHEVTINAIDGIADFMAQVKSTTKSYFNDTPQSPDPDLDTHVTTYNKADSLSDLSTPIARIEEIRRLYENELQNWCNEFINTFIIM